MNIHGKVAVITGAGSGMGAAVAVALARAGAKVAILDQDEHGAAKTAKENAGKAFICDVTKADQMQGVFNQIGQELGTPWICVNCAGIAPGKLIVNKDGSSMPLEDFSKVIDVNLIGTFNTMRLAAAAMTQNTPDPESGERGVIINTASIAAYEGQIGQTAYSASKGGVVSMTLPAARELARYGIRVVTIAPGLIATPLLEGLPDKVRESLSENIPFPKRFGHPDEVAKTVLHIIDNALLNGCVIRLDGALRMPAK